MEHRIVWSIAGMMMSMRVRITNIMMIAVMGHSDDHDNVNDDDNGDGDHGRNDGCGVIDDDNGPDDGDGVR